MYVCVCVCMYVYMYVYIPTCTHILSSHNRTAMYVVSYLFHCENCI